MKNYFTKLTSATMILGLLMGSPSLAAESGKIAVIDIQKIMTDSLAAKSVNDQVTQKRDAFQKQITAQEDKLVKENQELNEKRAKLPQNEFEPLMKAFNDKVLKTQENVQGLRMQLDNGFANGVAEIQKHVLDIVKTMSDEKKIDVVVPAQQLLFAKRELDITDEVLKQLDKKVTKIKVNFELPAAEKK